jgi:NADH:ubiquinone oxidoreductase subunit 2 (subunit N)
MIKKSVEDSECGIKYFLIQSIGSIILLFGVVLNFISTEGIRDLKNLEDTSKYIIFISLILKVGLPPFHYWFPEIVLRLD